MTLTRCREQMHGLRQRPTFIHDLLRSFSRLAGCPRRAHGERRTWFKVIVVAQILGWASALVSRLLLLVTSSWPALTRFCPSATSSAGWEIWWPVFLPVGVRSSPLPFLLPVKETPPTCQWP